MVSPFVILFTARSGSTAIYGDLSKHPEVLMRAEVFGNKVLPGGIEQSDDNRIAFLRKYFSPFKDARALADQPSDLKARGFKFQVTANRQQFSQPARLAKVLNEYGTRVVVLRRVGVIRQCISSLNARRLIRATDDGSGAGSGHVKAGSEHLLEHIANDPLDVDIESLRHSLARLRESYAALNALASKFSGVLEITYEQYCENRLETLSKISEHIGVDASLISEDQAFRKITPEDLRKAVRNYDALERFAMNQGLVL